MQAFFKREYDYAIRICAYLAGKKTDQPVPLSEIARRLYLTRPFATKIVYRLKQNKIIGTVQGKDGGVYLNRAADSISFHDILSAMGFELVMNECLRPNHICPINGPCRIHRFFSDQQHYIVEKLKNTSITKFAFNEQDLMHIE